MSLDMTFCPFWTKCEDGITCERNLTDEIKKASELSETPLSQFLDMPDCFIERRVYGKNELS